MSLVFGLDLLALLALLLALAGVVGSLIPFAPGAVFSLAGVGLYWWSTGYTDPGPLALVGLVTLGVVTLLVDWFGGAIAAEAGGASTRTTILAAVAGVALLFVAGPVGVLVGVAGTVFFAEYLGGADREASLRTALVTTAGMLASNVVQALLTGCILLGLALAVFL